MGDELNYYDKKNDIIEIHKNIKIKNQEFIYHGPSHPEILDLLNYLEQVKKGNNSKDLLKIKYNQIDDYFKKNCNFSNGFIIIDFTNFLMILSFLIMFIAYLSTSLVNK